MASSAADGGLASFSPAYHALDRGKSEIRLLQILPPTNPAALCTDEDGNDDALVFSPEPIRCKLHYASLDVMARGFSARQTSINQIISYLLQDVGSSGTDNPNRDTAAVLDISSNQLGKLLSIDQETDHDIGEKRLEGLREVCVESKEILEKLRPEGIDLRSKSFEEWLDTWIWTPLSGDANQLECNTLSYFALSYVWKDRPMPTFGTENRVFDDLASASGLTWRRTLELTGLTPEAIDSICGPAGGDPADLVEITIDDRLVRVGKNLESALRALREIPEIQKGTRVWIDAICINQQDLDEKSIEVKRMDEIYRKADRVISYLGEDVDLAGPILEFMDAIGEVVQRAQVLAPVTRDFFRSMPTDVAVAMAKLLRRS